MEAQIAIAVKDDKIVSKVQVEDSITNGELALLITHIEMLHIELIQKYRERVHRFEEGDEDVSKKKR